MQLDSVDKFRLFYRTNFWGDPETFSGDSSRLENTREIAYLLESLFFPMGISLVDLGCGDCNWSSRLNLGDSTYLGIDVVPELIASNEARYGDDNRTFVCGDIRSVSLPNADAFLARDVFSHFDDREILLTLGSIKRSGPSILILSTYRGADAERSIHESSYASVNLELDKYGLGEADWFLPEEPSNTNDLEERGIGVWILEGSGNMVDRRKMRDSLGEVAWGKGRSVEPSVSTDDNWAVCVDGRGYAYFNVVGQEIYQSTDDVVDFRPTHVPVSHIERRLTKTQTTSAELVLGIYGVGLVDAQPMLLLPSVDSETGSVTAGVSSGGGCLRSEMVVRRSRLVEVDSDVPAHAWLASVPLTAVLSVSDRILQDGQASNVHIWGAGVLGSLFAWNLAANGCTVTVSDVYAADSWLAGCVESTGATYIGSSFDYLPAESPRFGIDVTTEWKVPSQRLEVCSESLFTVGELDGVTRFADPKAGELTSSPGYDPARIDEAVELISTRKSDSVWDGLVNGSYSVTEFDSAIFPSSPTRFHIVSLEA